MSGRAEASKLSSFLLLQTESSAPSADSCKPVSSSLEVPQITGNPDNRTFTGFWDLVRNPCTQGRMTHDPKSRGTHDIVFNMAYVHMCTHAQYLHTAKHMLLSHTNAP